MLFFEILKVTIYRLDEGGNTSRDIDLAILKALLKGILFTFLYKVKMVILSKI